MGWFSLISNLFVPAAKLIDNLHTSKEEKMEAKQAMFDLQVQAFIEAEKYENKLLDAKSAIIVAEAQSQSWLARNWRPMTMIVFLVLVLGDAFGLLPMPLAPEAWLLLQLGLGGYVAGRSIEKSSKILKARDHNF